MWTTIIANVLPVLASVASSTSDKSVVQQIVTFLSGLIPLLVGEAEALITPVENIVSALQGNSSVSADQMAAVEALRDQLTAQVVAQAKADGLTIPADDDVTGS